MIKDIGKNKMIINKIKSEMKGSVISYEEKSIIIQLQDRNIELLQNDYPFEIENYLYNERYQVTM